MTAVDRVETSPSARRPRQLSSGGLRGAFGGSPFRRPARDHDDRRRAAQSGPTIPYHVATRIARGYPLAGLFLLLRLCSLLDVDIHITISRPVSWGSGIRPPGEGELTTGEVNDVGSDLSWLSLDRNNRYYSQIRASALSPPVRLGDSQPGRWTVPPPTDYQIRLIATTAGFLLRPRLLR